MPDKFILEIPFGTPAFDETIRLREAILRKPLNMSFFPEDIATEWDSIHLGCYNADWDLLGCLVLKPLEDGTLKMRQVAVDSSIQQSGVGTLLVHASEQLAADRGYSKIVLHARETAVPFYLRLRYLQLGERFTEVGIPHFKMEKTIPA